MVDSLQTTNFRFWLWLIRAVGVIVPRRLRADWRQEWEAELCHRELLLAEWERLDGRHKLDLLRRSLSAFWDALLLQPRRLEDEMFQDLRFGVRMLLQGKAFTLVAVLSLALGIGANTAIFSLIDALLLRALPVEEPGRLVLFGRGEGLGITNTFPNRSWDLYSYPFYREVRRRNQVFSEVAALQSFPNGVHGFVNVNGPAGEAELMVAQLVSGTYFSVLGVTASRGRTFTEADDQVPGGHPVVVISDSWWERRFGRDPEVVGKTINIGLTAYTIIGITPSEFFGTTVGEAPDLWVTLAMEEQLPPGRKGRHEPFFQSLYLIARLKDGVTRERAGVAVNLLFKQILYEHAGAAPPAEKLRDIQTAAIELTPAGSGLSQLRLSFSRPLQILLAMVGVLLLIACANAAGLLLARAAARRKEFAVRLALGARRGRLIRQLLTESLLLACLGGAAGLLLAWWGSRLLVLMASTGAEPLPIDVSPDARVLGFTLLVSLLSAVVFGTVPALRATRIELNQSLKAGAGAAFATSRSLLGRVIVISQVALSLVLLIGAGLFVRTLINLQKVPTGFDEPNVLILQLDTSATGYKEDARLASLLREVEERVRALPGVRAASFSMFIFNQGAWTAKAYTRGHNPPEGGDRQIANNVVGPDFFATVGVPLLQGRAFGPQDTARSQRVAVISEAMAERFFPGQSPLGRRFGLGAPERSEEVEIIGVVKDAKYRSLDEGARPIAYYVHSQRTQYLNNFGVRVSGEPGAAVPAIRRAIREASRDLPVAEVATLSDHVGRSLVQQRLVARLAAFFGLVSLLLACVGLYGLLSYAVARRRNEIGIRLAVGAQPRDVRRMVLREALLLVLAGMAVGLAAAWAATRLLAGSLFGLTPTDPLTVVAAAALLLAVAAGAAYWPARRASRVDPLIALRGE